MNQRLFCRERSFQQALVLTYSFDPIFFEQVVLPDLWAGRSSDILVLGDQRQIADSTKLAAGQLWHLGKKYLLAGAKHTGAFHPKVLLRLGPKDGVIMLGSGNVTSSGWGGNQELGTAWMLGPQHADKGGWLHTFLDDVLSWCSGDLDFATVRRMKDIPWLSLTPKAGASPMLHSWHDRALGPALAQRWAGRRFDEVKILTGSTDESGAFLRWAHSTFGLKRSTVGLTPSASSFDPDKLRDLPIDLRLVAASADRPLHAKLYWFDGPDGPAAVMGSANCSAAAWLLPPDQGGNVETVIVYDEPRLEDFVNVLIVFSAPAQSPAHFLVSRPASTNDQTVCKHEYELTCLDWDSSTRRIYAAIDPMPSPGFTVELVLGGNHLLMAAPDGSKRYWECELPEGLGSATVFASICIRHEAKSWITAARWINDLTALRHATQTARLLEPFKGLERNASSTEQRQMLDELHEVARALFNDTATFRDPGFSSERKSKSEEDRSSAPVNPKDLIFHLEEAQASLPHFSESRRGTLFLTGILQLLFDAGADQANGSAAAQDEQLDEGQLPDDAEEAAEKKTPERKISQPKSAPIAERFCERLAAQIDDFLAEMSSTPFAVRCTATQMVQAVSFPLAVALRGQPRGWVKADLAENWALEVFSILFRGKGPGAGGLLRTVELRYIQNEQKSTFDDVIGDGTLWIVLVATLGQANWRGVGTFIDKAVALREVFTSPQLLASAQRDRVAALLGKIRIEDAGSYVAEVAPAVTRALNQLEHLLAPVWKEEIRVQTVRSIIHKVGDLLWREGVGWGVCLSEVGANIDQSIKVRLRGVEKDVRVGFYVNVSELASRNAELKSLIDELGRAVSRAASQFGRELSPARMS
jgi:hypothetical protein